jgi:hypothetical protein
MDGHREVLILVEIASHGTAVVKSHLELLSSFDICCKTEYGGIGNSRLNNIGHLGGKLKIGYAPNRRFTFACGPAF